MRAFLAVVFLLTSILPANVYAASTFFGVDASEVPPGTPVQVGVFLNTDGEPVNAIAGDILLPAGTSDQSILNSGSLISLWLVSPKIVNNKIHFEGVIPGGITSAQLPIFSVVFTPSTVADLAVSTTNVHVFKNDGLGTELPVTNGRITLTVKEGAAASPARVKDTTPPEVFTPTLIHDPNVANGQTAIAFAAVDNDSGVDSYQIRESNLFSSASWHEATSPYVLTKTFWPNSSVEIRAIDRAGNIRTVFLAVPSNKLSVIILGGCILFLVVTIILLITLYRRRIWRKQNRSRYR